jgi:hypothetical protein
MTRMMMRRSIQLSGVPGAPAFTTANPPPMWSRIPSLGANRSASPAEEGDVEALSAECGSEEQHATTEDEVVAYPEYDPETEYAYHYDDEAFEDVDLKEAELW